MKVKVGSGPSPGNPHSFPQTAGILLHCLAYEITQPDKTDNPIPYGASLPFQGGSYSVSGVCFLLGKPSFTSLWLALEFFPVRNQEPTLGGCPKGLGCDLEDQAISQAIPSSCNCTLQLVMGMR